MNQTINDNKKKIQKNVKKRIICPENENIEK
jgi:hypothetical protein